VLMDEITARKRGIKPLARILGFEDIGVHPNDFVMANSVTVSSLLQKSGLDISQIDVHEIHESYAGVALANIKQLGMDPAKVNIHGGAISVGDPLGMSGARLVLSTITALKRTRKEIGIASIGFGGAGASAIMIQNID